MVDYTDWIPDFAGHPAESGAALRDVLAPRTGVVLKGKNHEILVEMIPGRRGKSWQ